jgi:hypothetical protein
MNIPIIEIFSQIVDTMRLRGTIVSSLDNNNNTYDIAINDATGLVVGDYITIVTTAPVTYANIEITAITNNTLTIKLAKGLTLNGTWTANAPYFEYEKIVEGANLLVSKDKSINYKFQKYPLIFLTLDIQETREAGKANYSEVSNLNIMLMTATDKLKDAKWRNTNTFGLILRPLYEKFMTAIKQSLYINLQPNKLIEHTYTEHFFMSNSDNTQNFFKDYIDAIEINISLKFNRKAICK